MLTYNDSFQEHIQLLFTTINSQAYSAFALLRIDFDQLAQPGPARPADVKTATARVL